MLKLNLVFHKICNNPQGDWQVSPEYFWKIFNWCRSNYPNFHIYFDDGFVIEGLLSEYKQIAKYSTLAIVTDDVGEKGYFSWNDLKKMSQMKFTIASHSVSHPSMCFFDKNNTLVTNPTKGEYINSRKGKQYIPENQIRYQAVESQKILANNSFNTDEFVFPYGLYSNQTIKLLDDLGIYKYYSTCDEKLYDNGKLVPRILIYGTKSPEETIKCLIKLIS